MIHVRARGLLIVSASALLSACPESPCDKLQTFCRDDLPKVQSDFEWSCRLSDKWFDNNCEVLERDLARLAAKCKDSATCEATSEDEYRGAETALRTVVKALKLLRH